MLDSSAVLAVLQNEAGKEVVMAALPDAFVSSVNLAEVASKLIDRGMPPAAARLALGGASSKRRSVHAGTGFAQRRFEGAHAGTGPFTGRPGLPRVGHATRPRGDDIRCGLGWSYRRKDHRNSIVPGIYFSGTRVQFPLKTLHRLQLRHELAPPRRAALEHSAFVDDLGDIFLLSIGHYMHARHTRHGAQLLDHLDADSLALGLLIIRAVEARDHFVRYIHARDVGAHPARGLGGGERSYADQE